MSFALVYGRRLARGSLVLSLLAREPELRSILRRGPRRRALRKDVLLLALVRAIASGGIAPSGTPFGVTAAWDEAEATLTLTSARRGGPAPRADTVPAVPVRRLRWIHPLDGGTVSVGLGPRKLVIEVGGEGAFGVHTFDALAAVGADLGRLAAPIVTARLP